LKSAYKSTRRQDPEEQNRFLHYRQNLSVLLCTDQQEIFWDEHETSFMQLASSVMTRLIFSINCLGTLCQLMAKG
jgi:hypothetical protein